MAEAPEKRQVYYIPDNYISESRIHIGQMSFRVRNLIDSLVLTLFFGIFAAAFVFLVMKGTSTSSKITAAIIICGPGFLLGQIGYNGDPISTTISNFFKWKKANGIRLYNTQPRLLGSDPVKAMLENNNGRDAIVDAVTNMRENRRKKLEQNGLVEGENFEFEYDPSIDDYLDENGDFADSDRAQDHVDIELDSDWDPNAVSFVFSADGYNELDEEQEINLSDYETN